MRAAGPSAATSAQTSRFAPGRWCSVFTAPARAKGLRGDVTRICFDAVTALPLLVEVSVKNVLLERYAYQAVKSGLSEAEAGLTPEAAGL